jgi:hypothetical protein
LSRTGRTGDENRRFTHKLYLGGKGFEFTYPKICKASNFWKDKEKIRSFRVRIYTRVFTLSNKENKPIRKKVFKIYKNRFLFYVVYVIKRNNLFLAQYV